MSGKHWAVLGIDPGVNGGLAVIVLEDEGPAITLQCTAMPKIESEIADWIAGHPANVAYIESVHAFPGAGVSSMFTFGTNYGFLRGVLSALKTPVVDVSPQRWQAEFVGRMTLPPRPKSKREDEIRKWKNARSAAQREHKRKLLEKSRNLFRNYSIALQVADAVLIAEYGRRQWLQKPVPE